MGLLGQFIGTLGVFERALGMPVPAFVVAFFIVFRRGSMSVCRALMFLSGPSM